MTHRELVAPENRTWLLRIAVSCIITGMFAIGGTLWSMQGAFLTQKEFITYTINRDKLADQRREQIYERIANVKSDTEDIKKQLAELTKSVSRLEGNRRYSQSDEIKILTSAMK